MIIVLAHAVAVSAHGLAHARLHVVLSPAEMLFVYAVIVLGPLLSLVLLWTRLVRMGAFLLLGSMAASLLFGAYKHFLAAGPDHIFHLPPGAWQTPFQITAALLAGTEALGCWAAAQVLGASRLVRATEFRGQPKE